MAVRDPYIALGVQRGAAVAEIKAAYRRRARVLHPDVNTSDPDAEEKFKELVAAYELLCDPGRRAVYDNTRIGFGESWDARGGRPRPARPRRVPPQVWSAAQVVQMRERPGRRRQASPLQRMAISPDLRRVASQRGETVHLWDAGSGRSVAHTGRDERGIGWLGFSPDGRLLITDGVRGTALWDALSGRLVNRLNLDRRGHLSFSSDGRRLATAAHTLVEVSDGGRGQALRQIPHEATVESIAFSADGVRLATAAGVTAHVWEVGSGLELARLVHEQPPATMSLSEDGRYLATCTTAARSRWTPSQVRLWEVESGEELAQVEHSCWVDQIVFSPDSKRLVTDSNGTMHLWDVADWRELARMKFVTSEIVFGPDGRWLTAAFGPDLYVWDAETGQQVACLTHGSEILSVAVDPDGRRIGTAGVQRTREQAGFAPAMAHMWLRAERLGA